METVTVSYTYQMTKLIIGGILIVIFVIWLVYEIKNAPEIDD